MEMLARSTFPFVVSVVACLPLRSLAEKLDKWWDLCELEDSFEVVRDSSSIGLEGALQSRALYEVSICEHQYHLSIYTQKDYDPPRYAMARGSE